MIIKVLQFAFGNGEERPVNIPDPAPESIPEALELVFYWGQNENQPVSQRYSVSVGDIINLQGEYYGVCPMGFRRLTEEERKAHINSERRNRSFNPYSWEPNI
jgi:hypothetical protein